MKKYNTKQYYQNLKLYLNFFLLSLVHLTDAMHYLQLKDKYEELIPN